MPLDIDTPLQHPADEPARRHSENLAYDARQREALRQAIRSLYAEAERQLRRSYATAGSEAAGDYSWELVRQDDEVVAALAMALAPSELCSACYAKTTKLVETDD